MSKPNEPRRWWIEDNDANREVPAETAKHRYIEAIPLTAYDAIVAELEREKRKVEKYHEALHWFQINSRSKFDQMQAEAFRLQIDDIDKESEGAG